MLNYVMSMFAGALILFVLIVIIYGGPPKK